ncbi:MAG: type IV toxin-antitoxin system AbiEi family antitoxin domain-containing protein, partial [Actinomycetes bacterium]
MDIEAFLRWRGGRARTSSLYKAGFSRTQLGKALNEGQIVRLRRGIYGLPHHEGVLGLALQHNALVTCVSATPVYQLWALEKPALAHVSPGHKKTVPGTVNHGRIQHAVHPSLPVAGLADVLIHALRCLPELEALVMVQCAAQRGDITVDFLRRKLPGNRNARARAVLDHVIL